MPFEGFEKQGWSFATIFLFSLFWKYKWRKMFLMFGCQKGLKEKKRMVSLLAGTHIEWSFVGEVQEGAKVLVFVDLVWELIFVMCPSVLCRTVCTAKSGFESLYNMEKRTFSSHEIWILRLTGEDFFVQYTFVTRHEENWGVGWYFGVRQGWCLQTMFSFPGYKSGVVIKAHWKMGGCVAETLLPSLVMPMLCSSVYN